METKAARDTKEGAPMIEDKLQHAEDLPLDREALAAVARAHGLDSVVLFGSTA